MTSANSQPRNLVATVQQVLPQLGLAYVKDDTDCCWGITRCNSQSALDALSEGARVMLTIEQHADFSLASSWTPLD